MKKSHYHRLADVSAECDERTEGWIPSLGLFPFQIRRGKTRGGAMKAVNEHDDIGTTNLAPWFLR